MEFDQAKIIVDEVRRAMENLSNAGVVIDHINDADLKENMKMFLANAVMDIFENIVLPVEAIYPELDPFR